MLTRENPASGKMKLFPTGKSVQCRQDGGMGEIFSKGISYRLRNLLKEDVRVSFKSFRMK
jgi:hypothetical protein